MRSAARSPSYVDEAAIERAIHAESSFDVVHLDTGVQVDVFHLLDDRTYIVYNSFCEPGDQVNGSNDAYYRVGRTYQRSPRLSF